MAETLKISSQGRGLPLVFIHGWGLNSGVWQPSVEVLKEYFEVITVDLPGFGANLEHSLFPYTLAEIATLIQGSVAKPAVYIGWSLGGLVASEIALNFPKQVKALITVASSPCFVEQENWLGIKPNVLTLFHRQLAEDTTKTINNFLKIQAMGSPHLRHDIKLLRELVMGFPQPTKTTLDESLKLLTTVDQRESLAQISIPFLRLYGKLDGLVPRKAIAAITALSPNSNVVIFEQASHAPFISHPEAFIETVTTWLAPLDRRIDG
ncbi:pimeloyl-ACP methyl ester esterase BioH [Colwellia hornerae]|uniref:Pimeloyl-[acyl-carrier protein] methyl ester esterase n=2 Tax=Colwellia hornerae TaxID=89402 RepID=A0A5C6QJS1_9GAMM|nr:pimeloyl-ACP methyl ester esterase BioH [Colwellia hornerae]TWX59709.1 pimeloyl-ACP methyl ester esterase BioH [Colwellia hornerae]TWX69436.1 pimeloyl-ACP methyl ester esterase BioH [Colwellia hornerae]